MALMAGVVLLIIVAARFAKLRGTACGFAFMQFFWRLAELRSDYSHGNTICWMRR